MCVCVTVSGVLHELRESEFLRVVAVCVCEREREREREREIHGGECIERVAKRAHR